MNSTAKRVTNLLIVTSVSILGALGLVRLFGYFYVDSELQKATDTVKLAELSNDQRMLGQQVARLANEDGADLAELQTALSQLSKAHKTLSTNDLVEGKTRDKLEKIDVAVTHLLVAGSDVVNQEPKPKILAARKEILHYQREMDLVMSEVSADLKESAEHRLYHGQQAHAWNLVVGLVFLAAAALIVAGPLRRGLQRNVHDLEVSQRLSDQRAVELESLKGELEAANAELKERHVTLRKAYDESTSANQFLMLASARFEDLFHGVPFACFSVDSNGVVFEWNEAATKMFGAAGHETIQKSIYGRYFGDEGDFLLQGLVAEAFRGSHLTNIEIEADCPAGKRRLLLSVFPLKAARKEPTAALIACADITLQKVAEENAREANDRVGAILGSIQDAFVTLDRDLVYRYVNKTAADWLGLDNEEIIGKSLTELTPQLEGTEFMERLRTLAETGSADSFEHFFEDSKVWLEFRVYPAKSGVSIFYNDITLRKTAEETIRRQQQQLEATMLKLNENSVLLEQQQLELEEANRNLQELATTDGLTGLLNHRAMQDELSDAVKTSSRNGKPVSVALLDVDNFKKFNDSFGHQAGDDVLRHVARILRESVRAGDIVARYGGEEFCVILPETDEKEAETVCERIRASVEGAHWPQRQVTISVGFSVGTSVADTQDFLKQADQALYEAKAKGRNLVCRYRFEQFRCA